MPTAIARSRSTLKIDSTTVVVLFLSLLVRSLKGGLLSGVLFGVVGGIVGSYGAMIGSYGTILGSYGIVYGGLTGLTRGGSVGVMRIGRLIGVIMNVGLVGVMI